jgi:hypothetical protein
MPHPSLGHAIPVMLTALLGLSPPPVQSLEVRLKDGTQRTGLADPSTSTAVLRLRSGDADAYIIYGVSWDRITELRQGEQVWAPDQFESFRAELARRIAQERMAAASSPAEAQEENLVGLSGAKPEPSTDADRPLSGGTNSSSRAGDVGSAREHARVRSVDVFAVARNWDSDVEWDGLELQVRPLDQDGELTPAAGTLEVTLWGNLHSDNDVLTGTTQRLGYWTKSLRPEQYGLTGMRVRLEYQNYHPDRRGAAWHPDHNIAPHGELSVRLCVPGQGVFDAATHSPVRLRRFSPLRDRWYRYHGTRYLPFE